MRKFVTAAATAVTLAVGLASPALADHNNYPYQGGYSDQYNDGQYGNQDRYGSQYNDDRYGNQYRYQKPMSLKKIARALAYQGFYGVRGLQRTRWGSDYRAYAFDRNRRPVVLRVNAFNGRVSDVRYL